MRVCVCVSSDVFKLSHFCVNTVATCEDASRASLPHLYGDAVKLSDARFFFYGLSHPRGFSL